MYFYERNEQGQKQCSICKQWKNEDEFNKDKAKKDGLNSACKICSQQRARKLNEKYYRTESSNTAQALIRNEQGQKQCSKCKQWKDESEFNKCISNPDGLNYVCKICQRKYREKKR